jgi:hypothetical protein
MDALRRIADAVLYEGYVLWPYRRSALKNQRRWTFGGVYPGRHSGSHPDDRSETRTECLVEGDGEARVEVRVRFLHVVEREVARAVEDGLEPVDELIVDGERHVGWDEAVEREVLVPASSLAALESRPRVAIDFPAGRSEEQIRDSEGERAGALVRSWRSLTGTVDIRASRLGPHLFLLSVRVANTSPFPGDAREEALRQTFCSTHTILRSNGCEFVSLTDPPKHLRAEAKLCENIGTWPVLVGEEGERQMLLSSPIILPDYPEVAPESPGDLFDAAEIDQMLVLNILSLTDEEKQEMRASDPKAREILERTESLSQEELMRLHGAIRELGVVERG